MARAKAMRCCSPGESWSAQLALSSRRSPSLGKPTASSASRRVESKMAAGGLEERLAIWQVKIHALEGNAIHGFGTHDAFAAGLRSDACHGRLEAHEPADHGAPLGDLGIELVVHHHAQGLLDLTKGLGRL